MDRTIISINVSNKFYVTGHLQILVEYPCFKSSVPQNIPEHWGKREKTRVYEESQLPVYDLNL